MTKIILSSLLLMAMHEKILFLNYEKSLNKLEGVIKANVNLVTEKAIVEYDGTNIKIADMIKDIDSLGYKAERDDEAVQDDEKERREKAIKKLKFEFIISSILSARLFWLCFLLF